MAEPNKTKHTQSESQRRKGELTADLARARTGIALHAGQVRYQSDVARRLQGSFRSHVGSWLTGAVLTGGLISLLPARRKKVYVNPLAGGNKPANQAGGKPPQSFLVSVIKASVPLVKPALTAFVTKQLASIVEGAKGTQRSAERTAEAVEQSAV